MPYSEIEAKFLGPGKELTREPCYKKLKSAVDDGVFPHRGGPDSHRIQEKTKNNRLPVATINFRRRVCPGEDKTSTDVLKPLHKEMPGDKVGGTESIGSQALQDGKPLAPARDDEIYSTSKAFIGPIYKPPEKRNAVRGRMRQLLSIIQIAKEDKRKNKNLTPKNWRLTQSYRSFTKKSKNWKMKMKLPKAVVRNQNLPRNRLFLMTRPAIP